MYRLIAITFAILFAASAAFPQTTGFTYQGRLTDGGMPANGLYDLQFGLFDSQSSGSQIGSTQSINSVQVMSGVFTVTLDFGANAFPGASRFLEISARASGAGSFTLLTPRQSITSTPYAVRSLHATTADSVPASGVPAGSGNYIQNSSSPQAVSNFNITGNGIAGGTLTGNAINATTQYNLNGSPILSNTGMQNLFAGIGAGAANTGVQNAFFGTSAGSSNTTGNSNAFFGSLAGVTNLGGSVNSFFGNLAGFSNTIGNGNSFFGAGAGGNNTTAHFNAFFGNEAGLNNRTGGSNAFFGAGAGRHHVLGNNNSFFGHFAGDSHTGGDFNTAIGASANVLPSGSFNPTNATAIGARAAVTDSNSIVLGSINGVNGATADTNVGIGTTAPKARLHVRANGGNTFLGDLGCSSGLGGIGFPPNFSACHNNYALLGGDGNTYINRPLGGTIIFREANHTNQVEIRPGGTVGIAVLGSAGSTQLCRNDAAAISSCSSSLRYKTDVKPFGAGLHLINRLQPVSFNWKTNQQADVGLIAEEVAKVEPRLTFKNENGEIEGVNYSHMTAVLINAIKEQQNEIEQLRKEVRQLRKTSRHQHRGSVRRQR